MNIYKEFADDGIGNNCVQLYGGYSKSVLSIEELTREALVDFPTLSKEQINVVILSGERKSGFLGIEFVTKLNVPYGKYTEFNNITQLNA